MRVLLVRHGMTPGNALRRYIGRTDEPLSPAGVAAAQEAGGDAALAEVFVTPLRRTQETAAILFPNARQTVVPDLREMDFGVFENRSADEMIDDADYRAWVEADCLPPCPGGESMAGFTERAAAAFADAVLARQRAGAETAVFVVHGGTIMAVLSRYGRPQVDFYGSLTGNCGAFRCTVAAPEPGEALPFVLTDVTRLERVCL